MSVLGEGRPGPVLVSVVPLDGSVERCKTGEVRRLFLVLAASALVLGCGLDTEGALDGSQAGDGAIPVPDAGPDAIGDSGPPDVAVVPDAAADSVVDVLVDAPPDAPPDVVAQPCSTPAGACLAAVPSGWEVAGFASTAASPCPSGYTQTDVKANPTLGAGACDCDCTITAEPCVSGTMQTYYSTYSTSCGATGEQLAVNGTGCTPLGFSGNLSSYYKSSTLPVGGACTGSPKAAPTALTSQPARVCAPPAACLEELCAGQAPTGLASCIRATGDVACPSGPFVNRTVVADDATFTCSACSSCSVSATCANPKISFYGNTSCTSLVATLPSDGSCAAVSGYGSVNAYKYSVDVQNKSCSATGPKTGTLQLQSPTTICCR